MSPRTLLLGSFRAAVAAADPARILPPHLPAPPRGRTLVVGGGKAAASMAAAVEAAWPVEAPLSGLVVTRYEHGLLAALLARPGSVLSRAQLMDRVWEDAPDTGDRTVDTHIKTLRAKLRSVDAAFDPIRTHRGMGYSIDVPR